MPNFPITEDFNNPLGKWIGYDTENSAVGITATVSGTNNALLAGEQHIDIRGLVPSGILPGLPLYPMQVLDADDMTTLDTLTMAQLDSQKITIGDQWTSGIVGPISNLGNRVGLTLTLASGNTTTTSTLPAVDLSQGFGPNDYVCLSLPQFPAAQIYPHQSYLTLSGTTSAVQLYLSDSFTTVTSGNTCACWPYPSIQNQLHPTTVGLTFKSDVNPTIQVTGIRLLASGWNPLSSDVNTQGQFFRGITTQSGTVPSTPFPMIWRCAVPQGIEDPRPINSVFGALFYTGSSQHTNSINLYARGRSEALITQLDLDYVPGAGVGDLQSDLDQLGHQPDFGVSDFQPSNQTVLNQEDQAQLNIQEQWQLERIDDITNQFWINTNLTWYPSTGFSVGLNNYTSIASDNYNFTASGIYPQQYYLFNATVQENTVRMTIDPVTAYGIVQSQNRLFDSGIITNNDFRRVAGRIGWQKTFGDGDAFVSSFIAQSLMFAEYRSKVFQSRTPVKGASLTVSATPPTQLFIDAVPYNGGNVSINTAISVSTDGSHQVYSTAGQGLATNQFLVTDFSQFQISFSLYVPAATLNIQTPKFALINQYGYVIPFFIGLVLPSIWQSYTVESAAFNTLLPGTYQMISISTASTPSAWYIDNLVLSENVIGWSARSAPEDPWNANNIPFVNFGSLLNDTANGVLFEPSGNALQVRAQAYSQNAVISRIYLSPLYSQLGNLIFN